MYKLTLFGLPALEYSGVQRPITRRKARALLAYLAVTGKSCSRESLAAMFWPESGPGRGLADLSRILSSLRGLLGPHSLLADRERVGLNPDFDLWVDVVQFRRALQACSSAGDAPLDPDCRERLEAAAGLYRDDFLAGFTLPGCPAFDEWQLLQTEDLRRDLGRALDRLAVTWEAHSDLNRAAAFARRRVGLDPLHEPAQRRLIALYARSGQQAAAHRQYQIFVRLLEEELGVEPEPETRWLYEQVRLGKLRPRSAEGRFSQAGQPGPEPAGYEPAAPVPRFDFPQPGSQNEQPFVARERELARLAGCLDDALAGNGSVIFILGGAGRGKTALLEEFARRAQQAHPDLTAAGGSGSTFAGAGDPFLPFREVMSQLAGGVSAPRSGGQLSREQAQRLWALLPHTVQAVLDHGPQLLDVFVSGRQLLERAAAFAPAGAGWLDALQKEVARRQGAPEVAEQSAIFGQFTSVLHHLAKIHPLLIILDDLQWMDQASIALLFHLGRRLAGSRILIAGAYRPDELVSVQGGEPHPLTRVLNEFKRVYGDVFMDLAGLDQVEGRAFIEALVDSRPNRLDAAFRDALYRRTEGYPLFAVELLRELQSRGDLFQDESGRWCAGQELVWEALPARVEAVIARRVDRLTPAALEILRTASVEGEVFTAEVVARVLNMDERALLRELTGVLGKQHRLVRERGERKAGSDYLSAYQFGHALYQQYLYRQLSPGERRRLHRAVAGALAELYAGDPDAVVVQLAQHYTAGADWDRAAACRVRAGDLAYQKASLTAAADHYQAALEHWPEAGTAGKAGVLCKLGECLWVLGRQVQAVETLQAGFDLALRAGDRQAAGTAQRLLGRIYWELGEQERSGAAYHQALAVLEDEPGSEELAWALAGLSNFYMHMGDYDESIRTGERALAMARSLKAEEIIIQCLCDIGSALSSKGDWSGLDMEQESLERALAINRPHDAGRAYLYLSEGLIYLGRYDQARSLLEEALAYTRRTQVSFIAGDALRFLAELDWLTGRWSSALAWIKQAASSVESDPPDGLAGTSVSLTSGRMYNDLGQAEQARRQLSRVLAGPVDSLDPRAALLGELARAEAALGRPEAAAAAAFEILERAAEAPYLFPNVALALLVICRQNLDGAAHSAVLQLERLDRQYATPASAACRLEGQGWLALAEGDGAKAADFFEQAAGRWQDLGHPYDQARALSGLSRARVILADLEGAQSAARGARALVESLAAQLDDPDHLSAFLSSALVQEIRALTGDP